MVVNFPHLLVSFSGERFAQGAAYPPANTPPTCSVSTEAARQVYRIYYTSFGRHQKPDGL